MDEPVGGGGVRGVAGGAAVLCAFGFAGGERAVCVGEVGGALGAGEPGGEGWWLCWWLGVRHCGLSESLQVSREASYILEDEEWRCDHIRYRRLPRQRQIRNINEILMRVGNCATRRKLEEGSG